MVVMNVKQKQLSKTILVIFLALLILPQIIPFSTIPFCTVGCATAQDVINQTPEDTGYGQFVRFINTNWIFTIVIIFILLELWVYFAVK